MLRDVVDEVLRVVALALQAAVHVDERKDDGVDVAGVYRSSKVLDRVEWLHA